jgi:flagellar biosynthetic protein FliR
MPTDVSISLGGLLGFLLVLARVGGALSFVPLPGLRGVPEVARAALAVGFTLALCSRWPVVDVAALSSGRLVGWVLAEAAVGIAIGVAAAMVLEVFNMAAQILGLPAGYSYASTIDPNSEADAGVLLVFAQLVGGILFFALGMDRIVVRLFAQSLDTVPAGTYAFSPRSAEPLIRLGGALFSSGFRLALPVVALLTMVDVALALLGRLNQQLQLLSLAFPVKMLAALLILSWILALVPRLMSEFSGQAWTAAGRALGL